MNVVRVFKNSRDFSFSFTFLGVGDAGIFFNDALMAESLWNFLWLEGEIPALLVVWALRSSFEMQEWRGEELPIGLGLKYQGPSHSDSRSSPTGAALPMQNLLCQKSHRVPPLCAESGCVICEELRGIRSASFGPIRKQIGWRCEPEHTQLALKTGDPG